MKDKWLVKIMDIEINNENTQKLIEKLIDERVIKNFLGKNYFSLKFIYKIEDEAYILKNLEETKTKYDIYNLIEQLNMIFNRLEMTFKSSWNNKISLYSETIIDLIKNDIEFYLPKNKQKEIFKSDSPASMLSDIFTEIGREQLKIQLKNLIKFELKKATFQ